MNGEWESLKFDKELFGNCCSINDAWKSSFLELHRIRSKRRRRRRNGKAHS